MDIIDRSRLTVPHKSQMPTNVFDENEVLWDFIRSVRNAPNVSVSEAAGMNISAVTHLIFAVANDMAEKVAKRHGMKIGGDLGEAIVDAFANRLKYEEHIKFDDLLDPASYDDLFKEAVAEYRDKKDSDCQKLKILAKEVSDAFGASFNVYGDYYSHDDNDDLLYCLTFCGVVIAKGYPEEISKKLKVFYNKRP